MAELKMMGISFREEYSGDWIGMHVHIKTISRGEIILGALLDATTNVDSQELYVFGAEEKKKKWLVPITQGKEIGGFGLTEPDSGSDAGALRTTAVQDSNE
jgi:alkylation response protein AidB-like acyl-CoA dehydrogenase